LVEARGKPVPCDRGAWAWDDGKQMLEEGMQDEEMSELPCNQGQEQDDALA
jgi:hypothetical protein